MNNSMNLLLISNSTNPGEAYLGWPKEHIKNFCNKHNVKKVLFIPYAGVNLSPESVEKSYDVYEAKVKAVYASFGVEIYSIHKEAKPIEAIINAECIAVGGGNTFYLVNEMHRLGFMDAIRERALNGMPYMGWSAGSNVACPTMMTTNDMPIIQPESFDCMNLVPFQINPHYLDKNPEGHGGETREQRILEFLTVNRDIYVVGLRERCLFLYEDNKLNLVGPHSLRVFKYGEETQEKTADKDLSYLMAR